MFTVHASVRVEGVNLKLSLVANNIIEAIQEALRVSSQADVVEATLGDGTIVIRRFNKNATSDIYYQQAGIEYGPFQVLYSEGRYVQATVARR